nr:hypothetical protein [Pseudonocardia sp. ICBG601]
MSRSKRLPTAAVLSVPLALTGALAALGLHVRRNMGARPGELRRIASASPNAVDGLFANTEPGLPRAKASARMILNMLVGRRSAGGAPATVPLAPLRTPAEPAGLAVTWLATPGCCWRSTAGGRWWTRSGLSTPPPCRASGRAACTRAVAPLSELGSPDSWCSATTTTTTSTVRRSPRWPATPPRCSSGRSGGRAPAFLGHPRAPGRRARTGRAW